MKNFFTLLLLFSSFFGFSQISINVGSYMYSQDFNTLEYSGSTGTSLPPNWSFYETGGNTSYEISNGSSSGGGVHSFGLTGDSERALGEITTNAIDPIRIGAVFLNNTGTTITSFTITYTGEKWRDAAATGDKLDFQYQVGVNSITASGTWINVDNLDLTDPSNGTSQTFSYTLTGLSILNNTNFTIRWNSTNPANSDDGLGIDDFTFETTTTLPVSITKFNAFFQNRQVNLSWSMANASNFDRFEVEHSTNGVDFTTLQSISTRNTMDYATTDANPSKGINYYRLKMMDLDGRFSYSEVKTVKVASETVWSVSPTKSTSFLTATVNENDESTIQLFNTSGQMVYHSTHYGNPKVEIPISNLTSGIYVVRISVSENVVYSERIIKE